MKNKFTLILLTLLVSSWWACSPKSDKQEAQAPIDGIFWNLVAMGEAESPQSIQEGLSADLTFDAEKKSVGGLGGCNRFFGGYELKGNALSFPTPMGSTQMMCPSEKMELERTYLQHLATASTYSSDGNQLIINCAEGKVLVFEKGASRPPESQTESDTTAAAPEGEIMQGLYVFGSNLREFTPCGEDKAMFVLDETGTIGVRYQNLELEEPFEKVYVEIRAKQAKAPAGPLGKGYGGSVIISEVMLITKRGGDKDCP